MRERLSLTARGRPPLSRSQLARIYALVVASGAALSFAFPEPDVTPLAWICVAPLLVAARAATVRRGAGLGIAFGLGFFGLLLVWFSIVGWIAWALAVLLEAAFLGLFGALWAYASRLGPRWARIAAAPVLWTAIEFLRGNFPFGGLTWGDLAQSQHNAAWMLRPAAWGGAWAVAFVVVTINALVAEAWSELRTRGGLGRTAERTRGARPAFALLLGAVALCAAPLMIPRNTADGDPLRVAIVQGNVPRDFSGDYIEKERKIIASHRDLTVELEMIHPDLVVWPESSVGLDYRTDAETAGALRDSALSVGVPMLVGANLDVGEDRYKVMVLEVSAAGDVVDSYQKRHLVPFGEFVPARSVLGSIPMLDQVPRDAVAGDLPKTFEVGGREVATVISFEGDFGSLVRTGVAAGGRLLVVATNTSTWGYSWASAQHVAFSQVRAVENGVWVAHAALSGISAFVAPDGTVMDSTELWTAGALVHELRFASGTTFYARHGDWLPYTCLLVAAVFLIAAWRRRSASVGGDGAALGLDRYPLGRTFTHPVSERGSTDR